MTLHYHGTPITPRPILNTMGGSCFCVSHADPRDVAVCHEIGQSVMLDNGAFTAWTIGKPMNVEKFYTWADPWLDCPTTWGVIPDIITGCEVDNKLLALSCPFPEHKMAPVWHMHESLNYLRFLCDRWHRVCYGSSAQYAVIGSPAWHDRIQEAFNAIHDRRPWIHMLRGMQTCKYNLYPFGSVDSSDIARHHYRKSKRIPTHAHDMSDRWNAMQCPVRWK